jgi:hypothetical protein
MAAVNISVTRAGNVVTVKTATNKEIFSVEYKTRGEIIDHCLWLARTGSVNADRQTIIDLLKANKVIT